MKEIPGLDELLQRAVIRHIFGTKMRSVIHSANREGIKAVVRQQFEIAEKILSYGLVPIIEPEVDIHSEDKEECEGMLKEGILSSFSALKENNNVILKLSIPAIDGFYTELMEGDSYAVLLSIYCKIFIIRWIFLEIFHIWV